MKRKRKSFCPSPLLDDSPKRTKVQAQRKFAQGSNVNSPVITPIKELEAEVPRIDTLPEPVELLPIKRPNTEDFLTFLCFRGTPILPPNLNFFNTASIVDTNGQVHEIKSEASSKNGPIDIGKCSGSSEKPFIAFGVRKRADPIVISRQMDRKRRHALAIQALRRKYQEQKMAKIRAVAISKLSEKVTNKTLVKTNMVSKTETVTKKNNTLQKIKVVATKHVKVTTQTQRTTVRPKLKQKMCLRSFRGRFVQKELPFRKRIVSEKKIINKTVGNIKRKPEHSFKKEGTELVLEGPSSKTPKILPKIVKKPAVEAIPQIIVSKSPRITRSCILRNNLSERRKQKRILITNPKTLVKPRILRTTTMKKTVLSRRKSLKALQKVRPHLKEKNTQSENIQATKEAETSSETKSETTKAPTNIKKDEKVTEKKFSNKSETKKSSNKTTEFKRDFRKITDLKKESTSVYEKDKEKKQINKTFDIRKEISKSTNVKKNISKTIQIKRSTRISNVVEKINVKKKKNKTVLKRQIRQENTQNSYRGHSTVEGVPKEKRSTTRNENKPSTRCQEIKKCAKKGTDICPKIESLISMDNLNVFKNKKKKKLVKKVVPSGTSEKPPEKMKRETCMEKEEKNTENKKDSGKEISTKNSDTLKAEDVSKPDSTAPIKKRSLGIAKIRKDLEKNEETTKKEVLSRTKNVKLGKDFPPKTIQRPTRKTKEAAAIYMEILSHKLVNDGRTDDDNISIDSFPELPNVKKTEQRENELKARAKTKEDIKEKGKSMEEILNEFEEIDQGKFVKKVKTKENFENTGKPIKSPKNSPKLVPNIMHEKSIVPKVEEPISTVCLSKLDIEKNVENLKDKESKMVSSFINQMSEVTDGIAKGCDENVNNISFVGRKTNDAIEHISGDIKAAEAVPKESLSKKETPVMSITESFTELEETKKLKTLNTDNSDKDLNEVFNQEQKSSTINFEKVIEITGFLEIKPQTIKIDSPVKSEEKALEKDIKHVTNDEQKASKKSSGIEETGFHFSEVISKEKSQSTNTTDNSIKFEESEKTIQSEIDLREENLKETLNVDKHIESKSVTKGIGVRTKDFLKKNSQITSKTQSEKVIQSENDELKQYSKLFSGEERKRIKNNLESRETGSRIKEALLKKLQITSTINNPLKFEDTETIIKLEEEKKELLNEQQKLIENHFEIQGTGVKIKNCSKKKSQTTNKFEDPIKLEKTESLSLDIEILDSDPKLVSNEEHELTRNNSETKETEPNAKSVLRKKFQPHAKIVFTAKLEETKKISSETVISGGDSKQVLDEEQWMIKNNSQVEESFSKEFQTADKMVNTRELEEIDRTDTEVSGKYLTEEQKLPKNNVGTKQTGVKIKEAFTKKRSQTTNRMVSPRRVKEAEKLRSETVVSEKGPKPASNEEQLSISQLDTKETVVQIKEGFSKDQSVSLRKSEEAEKVRISEMEGLEKKTKKVSNENQKLTKNVSVVKETGLRSKEGFSKIKIPDTIKVVDPKESEETEKLRILETDVCKKKSKQVLNEDQNLKVSEAKEVIVKNKESFLNKFSTSYKIVNPRKLKETAKRKASVEEIYEKDLKQVSNEEKKLSKNISETKETGIKRNIRSIGSIITKTESSDDSDQSFHLDVKVPRKKKLTRSKTVPKTIKTEEKCEESLKKDISAESDESTSDINLQTLANRQKNKKYTKKRPVKKIENIFCDSDEEPLSKLTSRKSDHSVSESSKEKSKSMDNKLETKPDTKVNIPVEISGLKKSDLESEQKEITKPKRECAKRPQNYLPMLSSSDDEDIFHGFDEKAANKNIKSIANPSCSHAPPLLDFLTKDIGRRWGKEKVNMSNEQIEKWLKDSALAGSSIKKENDEMLKFGERIPTETDELLDADKKSLFQIDPETVAKAKDSKLLETSEKKDNKNLLKQQNDSVKPIDRKLIFRKNKSDSTPKVNAFSPENESSVYAFGEETEELISTPFRRPSRRPSSTATSRSEDESFKHDDSLKSGHFRKPTLKQEITKSHSKEELDTAVDIEDNSPHFYIPQKPTKSNNPKICQSLNKTKLVDTRPTLKTSKSSEKIFDPDDYKYKVPSSPSASSSSSTKLYKRQPQKQKSRTTDTVTPFYMSDFPRRTDPAKLVEAPIFHPTDQEFQDPLEYIERIRHKAEQFGICRIVPPSSFKPECKVSDDMRFTAYNQYVHKMLYRWGPNFKELMAIKKYLETQNISITHPPWIGGMEIDLPRLYQTVQNLGGLKEVIEKKKWPRVSEFMKIPKSAQDRVTKLDDIYCKYLLPYDTLSPEEREKLFDEVETKWAKRESKTLAQAQSKPDTDTNDDTDSDSEPEDSEAEECTTKGRNMALNTFYRIARNTMSMYFKNPEPPVQEVEERYWNYVLARQNHICVNSGSIDSGSWGYGFAVAKNSPFARHSWNLKILTNNTGSFLKSLGPVMGVTVPTLHVGMVFSSCCWYRDPHGLPWIEYLHTGASKIWYGIPDSTSDIFQATIKKIVPNYCRNKELWLPSDTVMVPPSLLIANNVSLCRTVQDPGQFIVVFPKVFTSSISTGYVVSESVYFAPHYWLKMAKSLFTALRNSNEPSMFSLDRLLVSIAQDTKCNIDILRQSVPHIEELCAREKESRNKLRSLGQIKEEKLPEPEANRTKKKKMQLGIEVDFECEICSTSLFVSMVYDTQKEITYCLDHGNEAIEKKNSQLDKCKLMFTYDEEDLNNLCEKIKTTIESKLQKKGCK